MAKQRLRCAAAGLAAVLAVALVAAGCGSSGTGASSSSSSSTSSGGKVTLTVWSWVAGLQQEANAYMKEHPNVTVKVVNVGGGTVEYDKLRVAFQAGSGAPDITFLSSYAVKSFALANDIVNLDNYGAQKIAPTQTTFSWDAGLVGNGAYYVPAGFGPMAYFYRADIFAKYHITVPTTWAQFAADAAKLHKADPGVYLSSLPGSTNYLGVLWQGGQQPFQTSGTKVAINWDDAAAMKVSSYWQGLLDSHLLSPVPELTSQWESAIANGSIASLVGAAWYPLLLEPSVPGQAGKWRVALLPQWQAGQNASADSGMSGYAVTKQSANQQAAANFLYWLNASAQGVGMLQKIQSQFPTYNPLLDSPALLNEKSSYFGNEEINRVFNTSGAGISTAYDYGPFGDYVATEVTDDVSRAETGAITLPAAMTQLQTQFVTYAKSEGFTVSS